MDLTLDKKAYFSPKQETTKPASTEPVTTESLEKTTKESNTKTNSTSSTGKVDSTVSTSKKSN